MIRLPLEQHLEAGFHALKIIQGEFSERMYGEDIRYAASIDDATGDISVEEFQGQLDAAPKPIALFGEVFSGKILSKYQNEVHGGTVPFFMRWGKVGLVEVIYSVESEDHAEYKDKADQLITEGKANPQYVEIEIDGKGLIFLTIDNKQVTYADTLEGNAEDVLKMFPPHFVARRKLLQALHGKPCDPMETYKAIMKFILG